MKTVEIPRDNILAATDSVFSVANAPRSTKPSMRQESSLVSCGKGLAAGSSDQQTEAPHTTDTTELCSKYLVGFLPMLHTIQWPRLSQFFPHVGTTSSRTTYQSSLRRQTRHPAVSHNRLLLLYSGVRIQSREESSVSRCVELVRKTSVNKTDREKALLTDSLCPL